jgi:hypothetical protein
MIAGMFTCFLAGLILLVISMVSESLENKSLTRIIKGRNALR